MAAVLPRLSRWNEGFLHPLRTEKILQLLLWWNPPKTQQIKSKTPEAGLWRLGRVFPEKLTFHRRGERIEFHHGRAVCFLAQRHLSSSNLLPAHVTLRLQQPEPPKLKPDLPKIKDQPIKIRCKQPEPSRSVGKTRLCFRMWRNGGWVPDLPTPLWPGESHSAPRSSAVAAPSRKRAELRRRTFPAAPSRRTRTRSKPWSRPLISPSYRLRCLHDDELGCVFNKQLNSTEAESCQGLIFIFIFILLPFLCVNALLYCVIIQVSLLR